MGECVENKKVKKRKTASDFLKSQVS